MYLRVIRLEKSEYEYVHVLQCIPASADASYLKINLNHVTVASTNVTSATDDFNRVKRDLGKTIDICTAYITTDDIC